MKSAYPHTYPDKWSLSCCCFVCIVNVDSNQCVCNVCFMYHSGTSLVIRWVSLVVLIVQNAALVLIMRYARTRSGHMFLSTTAVVMAEVMKLTFCLGVTLYEHHGSVSNWLSYLNEVGRLCGCMIDHWKVIDNF